jgi:hypothetical protein
LKEDVDNFPLRPLEDLPDPSRAEIQPLSEALFTGRAGIWPDLDEWAARAYGLNRWDREVLRDTLSVNLPYTSVVRESQRPPTGSEVLAYAQRIERELTPFARTAGQGVEVLRLDRHGEAPWEVLVIGKKPHDSRSYEIVAPDELQGLFEQADREGASQVLLVQAERNRLLLGVLRQHRYWTQTQARLVALQILEAH